MKSTESLKSVERRAYRSIFEDGIYDIFFGLSFLILAWIPALESMGVSKSYGYLLILIPVLLLWLGKRFVTIPRLGVVEFGSKRKARRLLFPLACGAFLFLAFPLLLMMPVSGLGETLAANSGVSLYVALVGAPIVLAAAYFLDCPRMYVYAALLAFGIPHSGFLFDYVGKPLNTVISVGVPGAAILIYGLSLLFRFVQRYPMPAVEANHAG